MNHVKVAHYFFFAAVGQVFHESGFVRWAIHRHQGFAKVQPDTVFLHVFHECWYIVSYAKQHRT